MPATRTFSCTILVAAALAAGATSAQAQAVAPGEPTGGATAAQARSATSVAPLRVARGLAIHAGDARPGPASHGCVRVPGVFARQIFAALPLATKVVIR